nr:hypothetical protein [Candidatus Sigynarchaeota archaeon]
MGNLVTYVLAGDDDFVPTNKLEEDQVAFLVDMEKKIIYAWHGRNSSKMLQYKAGTNATKLKSRMHFFGFTTEIIKEGGEPPVVAAEIEKLLAGKGDIPAGIKETMATEAIKKGAPASAPASSRPLTPAVERPSRPSAYAVTAEPAGPRPELATSARIEAEKRAA